MMIKYCILLWCCWLLYSVSIVPVFASTKYYGWPSGNVIQVIDNMQRWNPVVHSVFEQKVRTYSDADAMWFGPENRITNGAWVLVLAISPYVQWIIFLGMSFAVIFIIYNWFIIVTNPWSDKIKSAKDNITNIVIGVLVLWWFYFILRLVASLILNLIWW